MNICLNSSGKSTHNFYKGIDSFLSMIFSYFYFFPFAFKFCQGKAPFTK